MRARALLVIVLSVALIIIMQCAKTSKSVTGPAFKTVHLFNLPQEVSEEGLLKIIDEFNQVFTELGYPDICYRIWKVCEEQQGDYTYLWESTWSDRATYDKVHKATAYKDIVEKYRVTLETFLESQIYNRYTEIKIVASEKK